MELFLQRTSFDTDTGYVITPSTQAPHPSNRQNTQCVITPPLQRLYPAATVLQFIKKTSLLKTSLPSRACRPGCLDDVSPYSSSVLIVSSMSILASSTFPLLINAITFSLKLLPCHVGRPAETISTRFIKSPTLVLQTGFNLAKTH